MENLTEKQLIKFSLLNNTIMMIALAGLLAFKLYQLKTEKLIDNSSTEN